MNKIKVVILQRLFNIKYGIFPWGMKYAILFRRRRQNIPDFFAELNPILLNLRELAGYFLLGGRIK